jgi:hypothetical protein
MAIGSFAVAGLELSQRVIAQLLPARPAIILGVRLLPPAQAGAVRGVPIFLCFPSC